MRVRVLSKVGERLLLQRVEHDLIRDAAGFEIHRVRRWCRIQPRRWLMALGEQHDSVLTI